MLVLGGHRSGTSLLTRLISHLGVAAPVDVNPAQPDNPDGYWEPAPVVREMEALLASCDSAWFDFRPLDLSALHDDQRAEHCRRLSDALHASFPDGHRFVVKDPRICRAVPLLRDALRPMARATRVVLSLRGVADVAASVRQRDDITFMYAGILWAQHMRDAELSTRDLPRWVIHYDDLLSNPERTSGELAAFIPGATAPERGVLTRIVRHDLRHQTGLDDIAAFGPHLGLALRGFQDALARLSHGDDARARANVDAAWASVSRIIPHMRALMLAEFASLRLSGRHMPPEAPRPATDARRFMEAMEELQASRLTPSRGLSDG